MENTANFLRDHKHQEVTYVLYILRRHLAGGRKKMHALRQPVVRPPEATAQPVSEPESESAPAPETPTEPAVEDISSNLTESLSEAEPTPEAEDTPSNNPDDEDIYSHSPTDFTEDISSGDALGDKTRRHGARGTFTVSPPRGNFRAGAARATHRIYV